MPNATVLDIIREVEEEEEREEENRQAKRRKLMGPCLEDKKEEALMNLRTVVFATFPTSPIAVNPPASVDGGLKVRVGHKYVPSVLEQLLFPADSSRSLLNGASSADVEMTDVLAHPKALEEPIKLTSSPSSLNPTFFASLPFRPVILETPKERYLFSPSILPDPPASPSKRKMHDISLILETEVTLVEEDPPRTTTSWVIWQQLPLKNPPHPI
ncbi:YTP1 [Coprinopsis cinerea AmutBmut pab1-1]|nr:YTP1 [Coprinopsis cinerea AmutBmut pab1-1]